MTEKRVNQEIRKGAEFINFNYLPKCAKSDLLHLELKGEDISRLREVEVEVKQIGSLKLITTSLVELP